MARRHENFRNCHVHTQLLRTGIPWQEDGGKGVTAGAQQVFSQGRLGVTERGAEATADQLEAEGYRILRQM